MMGSRPLTADEQKHMNELVEARKAKVAASLGKTVEEVYPPAAKAGRISADVDSAEADRLEADEEAPEVDEEAVLAFLRSRQETIERQRSRIVALESQVRHAQAQRDLAEKKNAALRDALAKLRDELKQAGQ